MWKFASILLIKGTLGRYSGLVARKRFEILHAFYSQNGSKIKLDRGLVVDYFEAFLRFALSGP